MKLGGDPISLSPDSGSHPQDHTGESHPDDLGLALEAPGMLFVIPNGQKLPKGSPYHPSPFRQVKDHVLTSWH